MSADPRDVLARAIRTSAGGVPFIGESEDRADAYLSALAAAGYAVVPAEPTEVMLLEGNLAAVNSRQSGISGMSIDAQHRNIFHREIACYRAMLAAAGETKE